MQTSNNILFSKFTNHKIFISSFFIIYFVIGSLAVTDYGIAFDENIQRMIAQNRIDYISVLFSETDIKLRHPEYGVAFELPALYLEKLFGIIESRNQYFFRHFLIFFTSFIGSIFFYFLAVKRFNSFHTLCPCLTIIIII